jgi:hypothetical protein
MEDTYQITAVLNLSDHVPDVIKQLQTIHAAMDGNTWFPNPTVPLALFLTAINELDASETAAKTKTKGLARTRDSKLRTAKSLAHQLKAYVQAIADANPAHAGEIIESAGMSRKKLTVRQPQGFSAEQGDVSTSVDLAAPAGAMAYHWFYSSDGGKTYLQGPSTGYSTSTLPNLTPGTLYLFRFQPIHGEGPGDMSDPISLMVR